VWHRELLQLSTDGDSTYNMCDNDDTTVEIFDANKQASMTYEDLIKLISCTDKIRD